MDAKEQIQQNLTQEPSQDITIWPLFVLGIIFLPGTFFGFLFYLIFFRKLKWRVKVALVPFFVIVLLLLLLMYLMFATHNFNIIIFYILLAVIIGLFGGLFFILFHARQLKLYPELIMMKGWAKDFQYSQTPYQLWKKRKYIQRCENEEEYRKDAEPLGVLDDFVEINDREFYEKAQVVRRYYSDAFAHTLLTGKTGSGKALHGDTLIVGSSGYKKIRDVEVGETLFDKDGNLTTILEKHHPEVEKTYKMSFSNGEEIVACEDHLWLVSTKEISETVLSTKELFLSVNLDDPYYYLPERVKSLKFEGEKEPKISPYLMGLWLANHRSEPGYIDLQSKGVADKIQYVYPDAQIHKRINENNIKVYRYFSKQFMLGTLKYNMVSSEIYIPEEFVVAPIQSRVALLSGLMDLGGKFTKSGRCTLTTLYPLVAEGSHQILSSLGWMPSEITQTGDGYVYSQDGRMVAVDREYHIDFFPDTQIFNVPHLAKEFDKVLKNNKTKPSVPVFINSIVEVESDYGDFYCLTVDSPSSTFLCGKSSIPTHNTVSMLNMVRNDIKAGVPVCVIDFKKSIDVIYFLSMWAKEEGRPFYHFTSGSMGSYSNPYSKEQSTYDPLSIGTATSKAEMMLNLRSWEGAPDLYKQRARSVLQSLFFLLENTNRESLPKIPWEEGGFAQFIAALDVNNLFNMIKFYSRDIDAQTESSVSSIDIKRVNMLNELYLSLKDRKNPGLKEQIEELLTSCRSLIMSSYGEWLMEGPSKRHINLFELATSNESPIILFSLSPLEDADFAKYMGSIILSDLSRASSYKNSRGNEIPFGLYIDEFQTLDPSAVSDLLEKARSAKFFITLSLQSLDQLAKSSFQGEQVINSILDTCNNFLIHDGSGFDTAEKLSKILGKMKRTEFSTVSKMDGGYLKRNRQNARKAMVSKQTNEDWILSPSAFQNLSSPISQNGYKSTAYYITKTTSDPVFAKISRAVARKTHVVVPRMLVEGVPREFKEYFNQGIGRKRKREYKTDVPIETISDINFKIEKIPEAEQEKPRAKDNQPQQRKKPFSLPDV